MTQDNSQNVRTKEEQISDIERKINNIDDQIEVLTARKVILSQQLKRMNSSK